MERNDYGNCLMEFSIFFGFIFIIIKIKSSNYFILYYYCLIYIKMASYINVWHMLAVSIM